MNVSCPAIIPNAEVDMNEKENQAAEIIREKQSKA